MLQRANDGATATNINYQVDYKENADKGGRDLDDFSVTKNIPSERVKPKICCTQPSHPQTNNIILYQIDLSM